MATRARRGPRNAEPSSKPLQAATPGPTPVAPSPPTHIVPPDPPFRYLRAFSTDPSLAANYQTVPISEVTIPLPWRPIGPGPRDEYLEVIDVDPSSGCVYAPVDLNDPSLLAQNGLAPSEGQPQFHQQMAYAVSRLTIANFERALGRKTLWRGFGDPNRGPKDDSLFLPRLRIHPHALREANAYYSPDKLALLFGYFNANDENTGEQLPGGVVFSCLSHDIVAHETTHALLDGMFKDFIVPTNPDVLAFHEGFADIVALLQHFTFPEILRDQIANTQGDFKSHESLLGQMAGQFGQATGMRGALRDAIGHKENGVWKRRDPKPTDYTANTEPHDRGAILVAAIFDAFLAIYERRTADLFRLATSGSGVLGPGAIPPDLVERLSREASKAAQHVLTMCIRALDYSPVVDITFGEYLRAIVTADYDLVEDDRYRYRVAFVEAFRRRGIYPDNVHSMSVESLIWRKPAEESTSYSGRLGGLFDTFALQLMQYLSAKTCPDEREALFKLERVNRIKLHQYLVTFFQRPGEGEAAAGYIGVDPARPFEVHTARVALRSKPNGGVLPQLLMSVLQPVKVPADAKDPKGPEMSFACGSSIVIDLRRELMVYCIRKSPWDEKRKERQQGFVMSRLTSPRATYVRTDPNNPEREPFALLHRGL